MTKSVPSIKYRTNNLPAIGYEIIELSDLYHRAEHNQLSFVGKPHRITFHNMVIITAGSGEHFVDFQKFPVEAGSLVFINKNQIHAFDLKNKPEGKLIAFTDEYLNQLVSTIDIKIFPSTHFVSSYLPSFKLCKMSLVSLLNLFTLIKEEYMLIEPNTRYLKVLFAALLIKISEARPGSYHNQTSEHHGILFDRFIKLLHENFTITRDGSWYAGKTGTSYKTLNNISKLITNKTVKQLIDAHVILEAKKRLALEKIQVQQVATYLSFDETSNFVKYFKKHTLMTPNQFKINHMG